VIRLMPPCVPLVGQGNNGRVKRLITVGLTLAIALATAAPTQAAIRVLDRARDRGAAAEASAAGEVVGPNRLWVKVKARPSQRVHVDWTVTCSLGSSDGSRNGRFSARTPFRHRVRMPFRHPDSCSFVATAQLDDSGRLILILLAGVPG
jgi:hypothetical protein